MILTFYSRHFHFSYLHTDISSLYERKTLLLVKSRVLPVPTCQTDRHTTINFMVLH